MLYIRDRKLRRLGLDPDTFETSLNRHVVEGLEHLGWQQHNTFWRHMRCGSFFRRDVCKKKEWQKRCHQASGSMRLKAWSEFAQSNRVKLPIKRCQEHPGAGDSSKVH